MDNKIIATTAIAGALAFGAGTFVGPDGAFDTKGQEVKIQVMVKEKDYQDAVYYTPEEWNTKTETEITAERTKRFTDWKALVEEQSKKENNEKLP